MSLVSFRHVSGSLVRTRDGSPLAARLDDSEQWARVAVPTAPATPPATEVEDVPVKPATRKRASRGAS